MQPVSVVTGRHPYQVAVHLAAVGCGLALTVTDRVPKSAAEAMHPVVQVLWVVLLVVCGIAAPVGAWWRGCARTGMRVELAGCLLLASATGMYAVALVAISGEQAMAAGSFLTGLAVAAGWRAGQLLRDLRRLAVIERRAR